ncbi:MAG: hypothetical protein DRN04_16055 [Thermoprotei archaeon]|nr:MAG: hypothetical protein DRN04_16055 [Thermoprotei archaeon]
MTSKWRKIVEKAATVNIEAQIAVLQETSERARHYFNAALGFMGLYVAVVALGYTSMWLHLGFILLVAAISVRYLQYKKILELAENIVLGDPPLTLKDKIKEHEDLLGDLIIMFLAMIVALIVALRL